MKWDKMLRKSDERWINVRILEFWHSLTQIISYT
jgi:hypothetical protein